MPAREGSPREARDTRERSPEHEPREPLETVEAQASEGDKPVYRYPGSGQAAKQQKLFKLEDIVKWDMDFGVVMGPVGYDPRFKCPYCENRMLLATHEGGSSLKGIRITYQCPSCGASGMTQFVPPGKKLVIPDEDLGEVTVVLKEPVIPSKEQTTVRNENRERPARPPRGETREDSRPQAERSSRPDRPPRGMQGERNEGPRRERREPQERRESPGERNEERRNAPRRDDRPRDAAVSEGKDNATPQQPRQHRYPRPPRPPRAPRPETKQEG